MITTRDLDWVAGFLEGEGCFSWRKVRRSGTASVSAVQVQRWPLLRLQELFGGNQYLVPARQTGHQAKWQWELSGIAGAGLMMTLYPLLSPRRQEQVARALAEWKTRGVAARYRSHCARGHLFDGTRISSYNKPKRTRICITCHRKTSLESYYRKKVRASNGAVLSTSTGLVAIGAVRG